MCTAISRLPYFGRTLDYEISFGEEMVFFPRKAPLSLRKGELFGDHHAVLGIASLQDGFPLYFDAFNEHGLGAAALAFEGLACYHPPRAGALNLASFEVIPYLLGRCGSLGEVRSLIGHLNITDLPFSKDLPASPLHWIFADESGALVIESVSEGLKVYENPAGVLTNPPAFPHQLSHLARFSHLSAEPPKAPLFPYAPSGRGIGGVGLPGDLSSPSRFTRAAFCNALALPKEGKEGVAHFFRLLQAVSQPEGCNRSESGKPIKTIYSSCMDLRSKRYYYSTYFSPQIIGLDLFKEDLNADTPKTYPLLCPSIFLQNACQTFDYFI